MEWFAELTAFLSGQTGKAFLALGSLSVSLLGVGYWIGRRLNQQKLALNQRKINLLEKQLAQTQKCLDNEQEYSESLTRELDTKRNESDAAKKDSIQATVQLETTKRRLLPFYHAYNKLKPLYDQLVTAHEAKKQIVEKLAAEFGSSEQAKQTLQSDLETRQRILDRAEHRTRRALRLEGNLWAAKALQQVPKFRPLAQRNCPIFSVLNLKGGVGKTTITAHLSIALARRGYRVLLVDLDLQGSLTQMMIPLEKSQQLAAGKQLVHHFLTRASDDPTTKILDDVQTVFDFPETKGALGLVAASDNLAYTELNLTLSWLLRRGKRDNRFLLRKALHLLGLSKQYDVVLLDCPPIVNVSCINALAASDYLLVPVTIGRAAIERVPVLLKRFLKDARFLRHINQQLRVMGLIANRTHREELTGPERGDWKQLATWCRDVFGQDVKQFGTIIQQLKDVRDNETLNQPPAANAKLSQLFAALADEIEQELPSECRRRATTLS